MGYLSAGTSDFMALCPLNNAAGIQTQLPLTTNDDK